jgi:cytochrome b
MSHEKIYVWDIWIRCFHWLLVVLILVSWWTAREGGLLMKYHMFCGYSIGILVMFRLFWGFWGSQSAKFSEFVKGPKAVSRAIFDLKNRQPGHYLTHNPIGGWVVLMFLSLLIAQFATGLFANDDLFNEGPLYANVSKRVSDWLTAVHHANFNNLVALIVVHVLAILFYRTWKREDLTGAMLGGYKYLPTINAINGSHRFFRAFATLLLSIVIICVIVNF